MKKNRKVAIGCGIWVPIYKPEEENEPEAAEIVSTMMITGIL